jgi:hypothetical protein
MLTLFSTLASFLSGGLPRLLDFFQDRTDKKHELQMAQMQIERELQLKKAGLEVQERIEAIELQGIEVRAALEERTALYNHDIEIGKGASRWVINLRACVRPIITYGMFMLFAFVEIFGFYYATHSSVDFMVALQTLWNTETQIIWASIVSFWFGTQAFKK